MVGPVALLVWRLVAGQDPQALGALFLDLWENGVSDGGPGAATMAWNSLALALGVALIKCATSVLAAFALVFFRLPFASVIFGALLLAMFFPVETRILPTFAVADDLGLLNTYAGMILPVTASGLGVLVLRQTLRQIPHELFEAARMDGAGPLRFLWDIILPLALPTMSALFAILFVLGWNQYLWPIMIATTSQGHDTLVRGMAYASIDAPAGLALAVLALVPPVIVVMILQPLLVRALFPGDQG